MRRASSRALAYGAGLAVLLLATVTCGVCAHAQNELSPLPPAFIEKAASTSGIAVQDGAEAELQLEALSDAQLEKLMGSKVDDETNRINQLVKELSQKTTHDNCETAEVTHRLVAYVIRRELLPAKCAKRIEKKLKTVEKLVEKKCPPARPVCRRTLLLIPHFHGLTSSYAKFSLARKLLRLLRLGHAIRARSAVPTAFAGSSGYGGGVLPLMASLLGRTSTGASAAAAGSTSELLQSVFKRMLSERAAVNANYDRLFDSPDGQQLFPLLSRLLRSVHGSRGLSSTLRRRRFAPATSPQDAISTIQRIQQYVSSSLTEQEALADDIASVVASSHKTLAELQQTFLKSKTQAPASQKGLYSQALDAVEGLQSAISNSDPIMADSIVADAARTLNQLSTRRDVGGNLLNSISAAQRSAHSVRRILDFQHQKRTKARQIRVQLRRHMATLARLKPVVPQLSVKALKSVRLALKRFRKGVKKQVKKHKKKKKATKKKTKKTKKSKKGKGKKKHKKTKKVKKHKKVKKVKKHKKSPKKAGNKKPKKAVGKPKKPAKKAKAADTKSALKLISSLLKKTK